MSQTLKVSSRGATRATFVTACSAAILSVVLTLFISARSSAPTADAIAETTEENAGAVV